MTTAKLPRYFQIIIFSIIFVLVVLFFGYFYRLARVAPSNFNEANVNFNQSPAGINDTSLNVNLDLFGMVKFINLHSEAAPPQSFPSGTRDPFAPASSTASQ